MVVSALFVITATSLFPAPWAGLPALGTALLIAYGERAPTARLLQLPPFQWIGAISYSLYLWHWPILAFWRIEYGVDLTPLEIASLVAAALVVATLSYRLIERPAMERLRGTRDGPVLTGAAGSIVLVAGAALAVAATPDRWRHLAPAVAQTARYIDYRDGAAFAYQFRPGRCFTDTGQALHYDATGCLATIKGRPNVLLIGDSMGAHIWRALAERHPDVNLLQATLAGCKPELVPTEGDAACTRTMHRIVTNALSRRDLARVILAGHWQSRQIGPLLHLTKAFRERGIAVTVIGPPAEYGNDFARLMARAIEHGDRRIVDDSRLLENVALDDQMAARLRAAGIDYRSIQRAECPRGICTLRSPDGAPLLFDRVHLTLSGARMVVAREPVF